MSLPQRLLVFGISHHRTPLNIRELFSLSPENLRRLGDRLLEREEIEEVVLLSTCNRVEAYLAIKTEPDRDSILRIFADATGQTPELLEKLHYFHANNNMLVHLFSVAAGLDSQMIGETEIHGQVKESLRSARKSNWCGRILGEIFERSLQSAKWARTHTGIGAGQVTLGNVVVDLVQRVFGETAGMRILLIGSGDVAELTARSLYSRNARDITVTGRSFDRAENLARSFHGAVLPFEIFRENLHVYDVVICSTAASEPILDRAMLREVTKRRKFNPVLLVDVAVPRDVDPAADSLDQVFLYNLDNLSAIANENLRQRENEVADCLAELKRRAWRTWLKSLRKTPEKLR